MKKTLSSLLLSTLIFTGATSASAAETNYTVSKGDTLTKISKKYDVTVAAIKKENGLTKDLLAIGQTLKIPAKEKVEQPSKEKEVIYVVKKGDTLTKVAKQFKVSVAELKKWNQMKNDNLSIGQKIKVSKSGIKEEIKPPVVESKANYTIVKGDTLTKIAKKYNVTVSELRQWNKLKTDVLSIGQKIVVNGKKDTPTINNGKEYTPPKSTLKRIAPKTVKGIYISGALMNNEAKYKESIALVDRTELNSVVIDVKLDNGDLLYQSNVPTAKKYGVSKNYAKNFDTTVKTLKEKNIYSIARIVTFKDKQLAGANKNWAIKNKNGTLYNDNGQNWINPYNQDYWKYVVEVAKEAASKGFDEIQFDYVRFPTNGAYMDKTVNWGNTGGKSKAENIKAFLDYAKKELKPYNVKVSADIFGIATSASTDSGIGHDWSTLTQAVDVMSPMMYPSHYGAGVYGLANPNKDPYNTIKKGLQAALEKDKKTKASGKPVAQIRPWFQDFSQHGVTYTAKDVQAQIRAAKELGVTDYLLWNASNKYTESALKKEQIGK